MMEKRNFLKNMKTLKEWQLEQQLEFNEFHIKDYSNSVNPDKTNCEENKENEVSKIQNSLTHNNLMDRIPSTSLAQLLRKAKFDELHECRLEDPIVDTLDKGNLGIEPIKNRDDDDQDEVLGHMYLTTKVENFEPHLGTNEKVTLNEPLNIDANFDNLVYSGSEEEFSDEYQDDMDGLKPLSESSEEEVEFTDVRKLKLSNFKNTDKVDENFFYSEGHEETVIEKVLSPEDKKVKHKSICPGVKENMGSQEMIEDVIEDVHTSEQETLPVSSTPVKLKPQTFLRKGEGLKRFECGNYSKFRKKQHSHKNDDNVQNSCAEIKVKVKCSSRMKTRKGKDIKRFEGIRNLNHKDNSEVKKHEQLQDCDVKPVVSKENKKVRFENLIGRNVINNVSVSSSADISMQKMLLQYKEKEERETVELDAFEALEEAAENTSLSSNCSLVIKHFGERPKSLMKENFMTEMPQIDENKMSYEFDDDASWSDTSIISTDENNDTVTQDLSGDELSTPPKRIISKKKSDLNVNVDASRQNNEDFSKPFDLATNADDDSNNTGKMLKCTCNTDNVSGTVKKKLVELEEEITKYRTENNKLTGLRLERESEVKQLRKEIESFQKEKTEELERIDEYREIEMKKIKSERKLFDKYQKEIKATPSKEEREEIKETKNELQNLREEMKSKESKWNAASHRFRSRIVELEDENKELREEVSVLEKQRLDSWRNNTIIKDETSANVKRTETSILPNFANVKTSMKKQGGKSEITEFCNEVYRIKKDEVSVTSMESEVDEEYHLPKSFGENLNISKKTEIKHPDGKVEVILPDKSKIITFPNGTKKTISNDEKTVTIAFFNGDIKQVFPDNRLVYYYAESQTTNTTYPDGFEMLEFPNNQIEKRYADGKLEVVFPDQTKKFIFPNGTEETVHTDGTVQTVGIDGVRTIKFSNGQKEVHTKEYKRREYPNGTVKTVYEDGRQETKYSNGRIRKKDCDGNLLLDTGPK